jgi:hypothetical protein
MPAPRRPWTPTATCGPTRRTAPGPPSMLRWKSCGLLADWRGVQTLKPQVSGLVRMGWLIGRVLFAVPPHDGTVSDHPSPDAVADILQRPTRELGRTTLEHSLSGLAPGGVCLATTVSRRAGGLLHHRFTLTSAPKSGGGLFSVALIPRVTPGGRYPPPCPMEPGPSSTPRSCLIGDAVARPAHPPAKHRPRPPSPRPGTSPPNSPLCGFLIVDAPRCRWS